MAIISKDELRARLQNSKRSQYLPGLNRQESLQRFVENLHKSELKLRAVSLRKFRGSTDPHSKDFHPLKAIVKLLEDGQRDEAVWLAFVTTHFGGQAARETVGLFYGKFGNGRLTWETVRKSSSEVRQWMIGCRREIMRLKFANHRKYETNKPDQPRGTAAIISSFVKWVNRKGNGSPFEALRFVADGASPECAFEQAYKELSVTRFGRTAKFDFLCLLGNLKALDVTPPHWYLSGATGPKSGALLMVTGGKIGRLSPEVERLIENLRKKLQVPVEVMEDALCGWQKRSKLKICDESRYVTRTCG
jgi:hypothetical protein